jgi:hypothetical protein
MIFFWFNFVSRNQLESDIAIEKSWRMQLQTDLNERKKELNEANERIASLELKEKVN